MIGSTAFLTISMLFGYALNAQAEAKLQHDQKPVMFSVKRVLQQDGGVVERLVLLRRAKLEVGGRGNVPLSPAALLARMLNPRQNGVAAENPQLFAELLDAVTEPHVMTALATVAMATDSSPNTPGKPVNSTGSRSWAKFVGPTLNLSWMAAEVYPKLYPAVFDRMSDPERSTAAWLRLPSSNPGSSPANNTNFRY